MFCKNPGAGREGDAGRRSPFARLLLRKCILLITALI
nr:MAG TPA: hypothetical protein [Bacteriophage sp.]